MAKQSIVIRDEKGMPRFRVGAPYKRENGWYGRVTNVATGKRTIVAPAERTKTRALDAAVAWAQAQIRRPESKSLTAPTLETLFPEWLDTKAIRPVTRKDYEKDFNGVYQPLFGDTPVDEITRADIDKFLKKYRDHSARTRQKHITCLRSFFAWCADHGWITKNPCALVRIQNRGKRKGAALTFDQARALLRAAREPTVLEVSDHRRKWTQSWAPSESLFPALAIAFYTGLRYSNIAGLRWEQVNLQGGRINIDGAEMKNSQDFETAIHPGLARVLRDLLRGRKGHDPKSNIVDAKSIRKGFKAALRKASLPDCRVHDIRHSFSSWIALIAPRAVHEALMGHAPATVTDVYTHVGFLDKRAAILRLPDLLPGEKKQEGEAEAK